MTDFTYWLRLEDYKEICSQKDNTRGHVLFVTVKGGIESVSVHPIREASSILEELCDQDWMILSQIGTLQRKVIPYHKRKNAELSGKDFSDAAELCQKSSLVNDYLIIANNMPHLYQFTNTDGIISSNEQVIKVIKPLVLRITPSKKAGHNLQ